jgi:hypothetical protein
MMNATAVGTILEPGTAYTAARTVLQLNAPATRAVVLLRVWISQTTSETATQEEVQILRTTTAGTGTSVTPVGIQPPVPSSTATRNHTAEGTAGDSLIEEGWEIRAGWLYLPVPEERITVPPSGRIALKIPVAPAASITIAAGITFAEIG